MRPPLGRTPPPRRPERKYQASAAIRTIPGSGREAPGPPSSIPDVSQPPFRPARPADPSDPRIKRAWWLFSGAFLLIVLIAVGRVFGGGTDSLDWILLL